MPETYNPSEIMFQEGMPHQEAFPDAPSVTDALRASVEKVTEPTDKVAAESPESALDVLSKKVEGMEWELDSSRPEASPTLQGVDGKFYVNGVALNEILEAYPSGVEKNKEMEGFFRENPNGFFPISWEQTNAKGEVTTFASVYSLNERGELIDNAFVALSKVEIDEDEGNQQLQEDLSLGEGDAESNERLSGAETVEDEVTDSSDEKGPLVFSIEIDNAVTIQEEKSEDKVETVIGMQKVEAHSSAILPYPATTESESRASSLIEDSHTVEMASIDIQFFPEVQISNKEVDANTTPVPENDNVPGILAREEVAQSVLVQKNEGVKAPAAEGAKSELPQDQEVSQVPEVLEVVAIQSTNERAIEISPEPVAREVVDETVSKEILTESVQSQETKDAEITRAIEAVFREPLIQSNPVEEIRSQVFAEKAKEVFEAVESATSKATETAALNSVVQKPVEVNKNIVAANDNEVRFVPAALSPEIQRVEAAETLVTPETKVIDLSIVRAARGNLIDVPEGLRRSLGIFVPTDAQEFVTTAQQRVVRAPIVASQRGITMVRRVA
jgi:hypothetical protein